MFKFLKDKFKDVLSRFSKRVDEESAPVEAPDKAIKIPEPAKKEKTEEETPVVLEKPEEKKEEEKITKEIVETVRKPVEKGKHAKHKDSSVHEQIRERPPLHQEMKEKQVPDKPKAEPLILPEEQKILPEIAPKKGFFSRMREKISKEPMITKIKESLTKRAISESRFNELYTDLEMVLLENNVAFEVIEKIKDDLKRELVDKPVRIGTTNEVIRDTLRRTISELLNVGKIDIIEKARGKKPFVIVFIGVNGSGKTTTIAKVANLLKKEKLSSVIAAADTFRAAAIQQIEEHAERLGIKLIKHNYGSDPAAVAFDAIRYAESKNIDVVLIDTAGRQHSNANLMDEMKKIVRISKPDLKIFIGESITGNDCVEQAKDFNNAVGIDAIILSKADVDEKGGAAISISYVTKKPIAYVGVGQGYDDLKEFDARLIEESLGIS